MNYKTEKIPLTRTCIHLIGLRYNVHLQDTFLPNHLGHDTVLPLSHYVIFVPLSCGSVVQRGMCVASTMTAGQDVRVTVEFGYVRSFGKED